MIQRRTYFTSCQGKLPIVLTSDQSQTETILEITKLKKKNVETFQRRKVGRFARIMLRK